MTEKLYANVTVDEYYPSYPGVNTASAEHPCANFNKSSPISLYINRSGELYPSAWKSMNYEDAIKMCVLIIIIIGGLLGNFSIILTIAFNRSMRTTVNFYIANLAVADFMTCVFAIPAFYKLFPIHYALGEFVCKIGNFVLCICMASSVLTLSAISCDRFMTVFFPLHVRVTKQRKSVVVAFVWILSTAVSIPYMLASRMRVIEWKDFQEKRCVSDWSNELYHHKSFGYCSVKSPLYITQTLLLSVFLYFVPILIMIIAYSLILWKLWRAKLSAEQNAGKDNIDSCGRKRMHKLVFIVILVFAICWTPYQTGLLYDLTHSKGSDFPKWWRTFAWVVWNIEMCNSFINPIIYAGMIKEFRQGMCAVLRCRKPVIRSKPPTKMDDTLDGVNEQETQDVNLDMEVKHSVADGR